ncbi:MAG: hypothetical protein J7K53_07835 [Bacteroidales bacterium]|nr:hypothetical protein [Bacteroidales bacterium]
MNRKTFFIKIFSILFLFLILSGTNRVLSQTKEGKEEILPADSTMLQSHSPVKASLYSAIFPGLGQIYNKKYWKLPLVYGGFGVLGYSVTFNQTNFSKYKNAYLDFSDDIPETQSYLKVIGGNLNPADFDPVLYPDTYDSKQEQWFKEQLEHNMDYYRRNRDLSYIGLVGLYLLNIVDATVDAHLFDYDIGNDLSMKIEPRLMYAGRSMNTLGLQISIAF